MTTPDTIQLLRLCNEGDKEALDDLLPRVYSELRRLARAYLKREREDHSLQPTALVHEAYLRLIDQRANNWQSRAHFFGVAAQVMRRILVDHARTHRRAKRGGGEYKLGLSSAEPIAHETDVNLIELDDALKRLAVMDPEKSRLIELRFFAGLTIEETAEVLGVSHATVERGWTIARAWLRREMMNA